MIAVERFKNERFRSHLQKMNGTLLVVDEAHFIFEWRYNFRLGYGHCSFCENGKAVLQYTAESKPLSHFVYKEITDEFIRAAGEQFSEVNSTKFLCGFYTPVVSKLKIKKLPHFGILENYPFMDVKNWIKDKTEGRPD